jgi:hypothetical protein
LVVDGAINDAMKSMGLTAQEFFFDDMTGRGFIDRAR